MGVLQSRTLSVSIDADPRAVYGFVSNPENLPRWAPGLCQAVRRVGDDWIVETPQGPLKVQFAAANDFGVLDHRVTGPAVDVYLPMRVVPNGAGSEVLFTLFRQPEMSDEQYAEDARLVEDDLARLKSVIEAQGR